MCFWGQWPRWDNTSKDGNVYIHQRQTVMGCLGEIVYINWRSIWLRESPGDLKQSVKKIHIAQRQEHTHILRAGWTHGHKQNRSVADTLRGEKAAATTICQSNYTEKRKTAIIWWKRKTKPKAKKILRNHHFSTCRRRMFVWYSLSVNYFRSGRLFRRHPSSLASTFEDRL